MDSAIHPERRWVNQGNVDTPSIHTTCFVLPFKTLLYLSFSAFLLSDKEIRATGRGRGENTVCTLFRHDGGTDTKSRIQGPTEVLN